MGREKNALFEIFIPGQEKSAVFYTNGSVKNLPVGFGYVNRMVSTIDQLVAIELKKQIELLKR